jgi:O-antigen/teichoic acid export membrane protein
MLLATAIAAAVALLVAAPLIGSWLFGSGGDATAVLILALIVPASLTNAFAATSLRTARRPAAYAVVSITTFAVYGSIVLGLSLAGRASVISIMAAWGIALTVTSVLGLVFLRSELTTRIRRSAATRLLRYGLPLAPVLAVTLASDFIHRAILLSTGGAAEVAHLTVALRFASLESLAIAAFLLAWQPRVFAMGTSTLALARIATDARRFLALAAATSLGIAVVVPIVVPIVAGEPYRAAVSTVGWCLLATLLSAVFAMASTSSAIVKRPADITWSTVAGIVSAVLANILLAARFGSIGTGAALVIGQAVSVVLMTILSRRALALPGPWRLTAIVVGTVSVATLVWTSGAFSPLVGAACVALAAAALLVDPTLRDILRAVVTRAAGVSPRP